MFSARRALLLLLLASSFSRLSAQGSQAPWRLSYFPYVTVSPNDGLMGIARAIWFRQAEWGDRVTPMGGGWWGMPRPGRTRVSAIPITPPNASTPVRGST